MSGAPISDQVRALIEERAGGDRSIAFALHALVSEADADGCATFNDVAIRFREDYLNALRAQGLDSEREAGRLSLDEVRTFLNRSVIPRLVSQGLISTVPSDADGGDRVRIAPALWMEIVPQRRDVAESLRLTGEHAATVAAPPSASSRRTGAHAVPPSGSVLEANGLVKVYRKRRVVNDVAVRLQQGEIVGLLGPNGAGKTTTFYMIVGLIPPLEGTITLDRQDITRMPMYKRARRGIGYLSQEPSIFRKLSVEDNILAILETLPISRREREERLENGRDVLFDGEATKDGGLLRQVPDALSRPHVHRVVGDVFAVEHHAPGVGADQTDDHGKGRGLARSVGAEQADDLARRHVDVHALDDGAAAVSLREFSRVQRRHQRVSSAGHAFNLVV